MHEEGILTQALSRFGGAAWHKRVPPHGRLASMSADAYNVPVNEEGSLMPFVQITWVAGRSPEQKRDIVKRVTAALVEEGKAKIENVHVTFVDLPPTDYAESGVTVADQKRKP